MNKETKVAIVGVGKIGGALASGLLNNKVVKSENLAGSTAHKESAQKASKKYGIKIHTDNKKLVTGKDIIILAVKPQAMEAILEEIKNQIKPQQLLITIAAAVTTKFVEKIISPDIPVIRAMPNTPCLANEGMTVICPGKYATKNHLKSASRLFNPLGRVEEVKDEEFMDAVTALSGSGPAYVDIIIESLAEGGVKVGLPRKLATILSAQTVLGAAKMVLETGEHPAKLKDLVTTPAGTTINGIMELERGGLRIALINAVAKATQKSKELTY